MMKSTQAGAVMGELSALTIFGSLSRVVWVIKAMTRFAQKARSWPPPKLPTFLPGNV